MSDRGTSESIELLGDVDSDQEDAVLAHNDHVKSRLTGRASRRQWLLTPYTNIAKLRRCLLGRRSRQLHTHPAIALFTRLRGAARSGIVYTFFFLLALSILRAIFFPSYNKPPAHYHALRDDIRQSNAPGRGNKHNEKIFIAANILQEDLIRGAWGDELIELISLIGPENAFLSIYENDSGEGTAKALRELKTRVPLTGEHLPLDGFPTVTIPSGDKRVRRLGYLAEVRNRLLRPLGPPSPNFVADSFERTDMIFDRVLFLNDVYFSATDAAQLLFSTHQNEKGRADYRVACAVDFIGWTMMYDTFVVRDHEGYGMGFQFFPWFSPSGRAESRQDVLAEKDAVRVQSCWNGMVSYDAKFFQTPVDQDRILSGTSTTRPEAPKSLLKFRYEQDLFWEGAECCLINADIQYLFPHDVGLADSGIYLNPYVRVAYKPSTYSWIGTVKRFEKGFAIFQYIISWIAYPEYNPRRMDKPGQLVAQRVWKYSNPTASDSNPKSSQRGSLQGSYEDVMRIATPGGYCGQQRMFVMKQIEPGTNKNGAKNWEKISPP